jgi:hypothetical protein
MKDPFSNLICMLCHSVQDVFELFQALSDDQEGYAGEGFKDFRVGGGVGGSIREQVGAVESCARTAGENSCSPTELHSCTSSFRPLSISASQVSAGHGVPLQEQRPVGSVAGGMLDGVSECWAQSTTGRLQERDSHSDERGVTNHGQICELSPAGSVLCSVCWVSSCCCVYD